MKKLYAMLVFFAVTAVSLSAQRTVTGTLIDGEGLSLIGANVLVKGTTIGTITDIDGSFSLEIPTGSKTMVFSYTGYNTVEMPIGESNNMDVTMSLNSQIMDEVVITGYGSAKKSSLIESISTIKGEAITKIPIASVDNLLQGRSTGVEVTAINGKPGQNAYIRIRGLTSINGNNDPLFIVDGVPVPQSVYSAINPNDISEFSILKDAAATAIYGARGSAGVVLITTKQGDRKQSFVEYSVQIGSKKAVDDGFQLMNASEKLNYEIATGVRGALSETERADLLEYGTDWEDALLNTGNLISHNLAFSGGNENGSYYVSFSRFDEQGISLGSDFDRTSVKLNGTYNVNDWIEVSNNLNISRRNDNELRDRYNVQSPFVGLYIYNPYETIFDLDPSGDVQFDEFGDPVYNFTHSGFNVVEAIQNNPETRQWSDMYGSLRVTLTPIENLRITTTGGYTYNTFEREYFIKPNSILDFYVGDTDAPGIKTDSYNDRDRYIWNNVAQYDYNLNDQNSFSFLAGTEYVYNLFEAASISGKGFPIGLRTQNVAAEITGGSTSNSEFSLFSLFGSVNYTYNNNLQLKATVRRDGSSRFGQANRYGTFYAVGAGYDISKSLLADNATIDQLKIRASYGTTGNEPSGLYDAIGVIDFTSYADQTAALQGNVANPNLKWETQKAISVGIDFGILNNKVTGSLEYYNKKSVDLLFPNQLSRTTGFGSITDNIGDLQNTGIDAEIMYSPLRESDFTLDLGIRFSKNRAKITKLNTDEQIDPSNAFGSILKVGEVAYVWELVEYIGVDPATGDLLYLNAEGEQTTSPIASDAKILSGKSALPTYWGGFDINLGYKGLQVSTSFSFKGGNYIYNQRRRDLLAGLDGARDNQIIEAFDYWKNPGDVTSLPRPDVEVEPTDTDRFLEKGDYIRLRNVQLSYQIPNNIVSKLKLQSLSVFIAGTNLATFTNFIGDPEVGVFIEESASSVGGQLPGEYAGFSYPTTKSVTAGLNVRF